MTAMPMRELTGKHVLLICAGFFGVMLAVNTAFVFFAISTFGGGEGSKAYQTGLDYNKVIAAARAQEALGWSHRIEAGTGGQVRVALTDRGGGPVARLTLTGEIGRPADDQFTRALAFREASPGVYAAETGPLDAGNWVMSLTAARRQGETDSIVYRAKDRLWLKPNS